MEYTAHLLVVDDDVEIRELLAEVLQKFGFKVILAADGEEMLYQFDKHPIDLIILDVMLPGEDGLSLCRRLRAISSVPIIMLTASGDETDRVVGLECGADDYIAKPFSPRELVARIRAILRRIGEAAQPRQSYIDQERNQLAFSGWRLDTATRRLCSTDDIEISLSSGEFNLLLTFLKRPKRVLSREQLLDFTYNRSAGPFDRSIDIQVSRLRQKIEMDPKNPQIITTVRGGGYMLNASVKCVATLDSA